MLHTHWAKEMAEVINSYAPNIDPGPEGMASEDGYKITVDEAEALSEVLMIAGYGFELTNGCFRCRYRQGADCGVVFAADEDRNWYMRWFTDHIKH